MQDPAKPKPKRSYEAEFQAWKRAKDPEFQAWKAAKGAPEAAEAPESANDKALGLVRHAYQGLTFGLGDKLTAGTRMLLPESLGGTKPGTTLEEVIREERGNLERFREKHPFVAGAADAVGSIPPMVLTAGQSEAPTLARSMVAGGRFGGARAAGESAGEVPLEDVLKNTAKGMAVGAGTAGAIHGAVRTPSAFMDWTGLRPSRTNPGRVGRIALRMGVAPREDAALETIIQKSEQARKTPADMTAAVAEGRELGKPVTLMEVLGTPATRLTRGAQGVPSQGADDIRTALESRRQGSAGRVAGDVEQGFGKPRQDTFTARQQVAEQQKAAAKPLYAKAMAANPVPLTAAVPDAEGVTLATVLKRPSVQQALAYDAKLGREEGRGMGELLANTRGGAMTMEQLHNVKLRLDEMIGYGKRTSQLIDGTPATKQQLGAMRDTKNQLLAIMDAHSKDYKAARASWGGDAELDEALEFGRAFLTGGRSSPQLAHELSEFSAAGQDHARTGVIDAVRDQIDRAPDGADVVRRIFGNTLQRSRLRVAFPSEQAFQRFEQQMKLEARMSANERTALGGSPTAEKLADQADIAEPIPSPGNMFSWRGAANAVLRTADRARNLTLTKQKVDALAPYLTAGSGAPGTRTLEDVLGEMSRVQGRRASAARPGQVVRALSAGAAARRVASP